MSPFKICMRYMVHLHFPSSNNVAKYEALINGLRIVVELGIDASTFEEIPSWSLTTS